MTFVTDERVKHLVSLVANPVLVADRFELGTIVGEGGMGVVYEAWDCQAERSVALKVLHRSNGSPSVNDPTADVAQAARFDREANALARISHPSIVEYVAHGVSAEGDRYLAMELLAGQTLAQRLAAGPLGLNEALHVGHGVATALAVVHEHALTHRDVKPGNIFLQEGDAAQVKLLDFGLVRAQGETTVTRTGSLVGTPSYMAPEQIRATSAPDARSDLFALGAVLFECLTGRAAFLCDDTEGLLTKMLIETPSPVRELRPDVPEPLNELIAELLAADPLARPATAEAVTARLSALLQTESTHNAPRVVTANRAVAPTSMVGALIAGKYRVERELGRGGMGVVLLAHHELLDRYVALKLLNGDKHDAKRAVARLAREARATSALTSEHVARVMDVDTHDGTPFIVMEYLRGKDLSQLLTEQGRLPLPDTIDYVLQASEALAEAHVMGIVHRDLKPSNLFLTTRKDGTPLIKVLDFGISKLPQVNLSGASSQWVPEGSITAPDAVLGSPLYMSPEQLQNTRQVDPRTDIWSMGVVLYQLLTGRLPFEAESVMALGAKIAAGTPTDLRQIYPDAPVGLGEVVLRCLAKSPKDRFANVALLARALAPYAPSSALSSVQRIERIGGSLRSVEANEGVTATYPEAATPESGAIDTGKRGRLGQGRWAAWVFGASVLGVAALGVVTTALFSGSQSVWGVGENNVGQAESAARGVPVGGGGSLVPQLAPSSGVQSWPTVVPSHSSLVPTQPLSASFSPSTAPVVNPSPSVLRAEGSPNVPSTSLTSPRGHAAWGRVTGGSTSSNGRTNAVLTSPASTDPVPKLSPTAPLHSNVLDPMNPALLER